LSTVDSVKAALHAMYYGSTAAAAASLRHRCPHWQGLLLLPLLSPPLPPLLQKFCDTAK
jgi:hypothetical protein